MGVKTFLIMEFDYLDFSYEVRRIVSYDKNYNQCKICIGVLAFIVSK